MTQPNAETEKLAKLESALSGLAASHPVDVEAALRKVKARIQPRSNWGQYAGWAAAAGLVLVAGLMWRSNVKAPSTAVTDAAATYATKVGARDSVVLADGSRIVLGPASRVTVRGREVVLEGEAFFAVTHNEQAPFTVRAGDAVIRDIGTEFTVHSDHGAEVRVVVREGSVALSRQADSVVLTKGDVGMLDGGRVTASRGMATDADLAWTTGRLVFRDAEMSDVVADLRRWYGVELKVTDSAMLKRHYTGTFEQSDAPDGVFNVIAAALQMRADRRGDTVYIRPLSTTK